MPTAAWRPGWLSLIVLVVAGGGAYVVASTLGADWPQNLPWEPGALRRLATLIAAIALATALLARVFDLSPAASAVVTATIALVLLGAAWPLLVLLAIAVASTLVGRRLRRWWRDDAGEDALGDLVLGAGVYASVVGVLAHWPVGHPATYATLIALPIAADPRGAADLLKWGLSQLRTQARTARFPAWIAGTLAVVYPIVALFPELGWDALAVHLFIPGHVTAHRAWNFDVQRFSWALMPALGDWLFTLVHMFDGTRGTRLTNAACTLLVAAYVHRFATLAGASRGWAYFAAALWLSTPVTFTVGSSVFVDVEWTLFVLAAIDALLRPAVPGRAPRSWITAGALIGFAAAAKAVTLALLPAIALAAIAQRQALRTSEMPRVLALALAAAVLAGAKPYVTAWALTGNPVYPFFIHVFGGPPFDYWGTGPSTFRAPLAWSMPWDATFHAERYIEGRTGAPGFQWLILMPAALLVLGAARARRGLLIAAIGVAIVVLVFSFQSYLRYILPALALLVAACGAAAALAQQRERMAGPVFAAAAAITLTLNVVYLNAAARYRELPLEVVASERARQRYIARMLPVQRATEVAARLPAVGARVAFFSLPAFALAPEVDAIHASWYTPGFERAIREAESPDALARVLARWRVRYVVVDEWWTPLDPQRRVELATAPVVQFAGASVREVRSEVFFPEELLRNAELDATDGWAFMAGARHDPVRGVAIVTVESPAFQRVPVRPGDVYRLAVRARCDGTGTVRAQVNWHGADENFLFASLQTFACNGDWREPVHEIVAPRHAASGYVYATGGASAPVEIDRVSFRSAAARGPGR